MIIFFILNAIISCRSLLDLGLRRENIAAFRKSKLKIRILPIDVLILRLLEFVVCFQTIQMFV